MTRKTPGNGIKQEEQFPSLSVIIPVFNSEHSIGDLVAAVVSEVGARYDPLEIVLVNDGSADGSHEVILDLIEGLLGSSIKYVQLARNFGEHNAVMTGLRYCGGEIAVIIDDDFQNPPSEITALVDELKNGHDVVYSHYEKKRHSLFRNMGSKLNDIAAGVLLKKPRGLYLSSFKAMNRFLIDELVSYDGPYPYVDGLILRSTDSIGTKLCKHEERRAGQSNYTLRKLIRLWLNMSTGGSFAPLRLGAYLGLFMAMVGLGLAVFFASAWYFGGIISESIPKGWASIIVTTTIFSGIQLFVLGMTGEYVGRLYMSQNQQPQAVVRRVIKGGAREDG